MSDSQQWYMSIGGHQVGPVSAQEIISQIRSGSIQSSTFLFTPGMSDWVPAGKVEFFRAYFGGSAPPVAIPKAPGRDGARN